MQDLERDLEVRGYRTERVLGRNNQGGRVTLRCERISDGARVVIKHFSFARQDADWDGYKAHEREIEALRALSHPAIPRFLDAFALPTGFALVQAHIDAEPLDSRRHWDFKDVQGVAREVLEVLSYLQAQRPAVIHRDLKPDNLLRDRDGRLYVIDFGLAKSVEDRGMSTMSAGTPGFMAPEQFFMRPLTLATDLYGLGATLVALLSERPATEIAELVDTSFQFDLSGLKGAAPPWFLSWLERLLAPRTEDRFPDASRALVALGKAEQRAREQERARPAAEVVSRPQRAPVPLPRRRPDPPEPDIDDLELPDFRRAPRHSVLTLVTVGVAVVVGLVLWRSAMEGTQGRETAAATTTEAPPSLSIKGRNAICPTGAALTVRAPPPEMKGGFDGVRLEAGCALTFEGVGAERFTLRPGARLSMRDAVARQIHFDRAGGGDGARLALERVKVSHEIRVRAGELVADEVVAERLDVAGGSSATGRDLVLSYLRVADSEATIDEGRIGEMLSLQRGTLRATELVIAARVLPDGPSLLVLDRPVFEGPVDLSHPELVAVLRAPVASTPPTPGPFTRILAADEAIEPVVAALLKARDEAAQARAGGRQREADIAALKGQGCAPVTACVGADPKADGPGEARLAARDGALTLESATHGEDCLRAAAAHQKVPEGISGTLRCGWLVDKAGGTRLVRPTESAFEAGAGPGGGAR